MTAWLELFGGGLAFGAGLVAAMALPRRLALLGPLVCVIGTAVSLAAFGTVSRHYGTLQAIGVAVLFAVVGAAAGYGLSAIALPLLARRPKIMRAAAGEGERSASVILLACADPEHYSPRAVAARGNDLADGGAMDLPTGALPFVFLSERARYRAVGGRSPAAAAARAVATGASARLTGAQRRVQVDLAWCYAKPSLANAVVARVAAGSDRIAVVVLGSEDAEPVDRAKADLDRARPRDAGVEVVFGPSVWSHRALPERLAERVLGATSGVETSAVGVVLVGVGVPPAWAPRHLGAASEENYFNQRVRLLLSEAGLDEQTIRVAWLDWQLPDVTEAVRHVAALGCTRIVVAPSTIALPTIATVLDIKQGVDLARLPEGVQAVILAAWGDDGVFVDAVVASAERGLALTLSSAT